MKKLFCILLSMLIVLSCFGVFSACEGVDFGGNKGGGDTTLDGSGDQNDDNGDNQNPSNPDSGENSGNTGDNNNADTGNGDASDDNDGDQTGDTSSLPQTVVLDKITYTLLSSNTYSITSSSITSSDTQIVIPEKVEGADVTEIGEDAFRGKKMQKVTLPQTVTKIGVSAFNACSSLRVINLGDVQFIGNTAFKGSSILSANLSSTTYIGKGAFSGTNIQTVSIPEGITEIYQDTFSGCSILNTVTLPQSVTQIGDSAFKNCSALLSINLENVEYVGYYAFQSCVSLQQVNMTKVVYIKDYAFFSTGLKNVTIGNDCIQIYLDAFTSCSSLQTIDLASAHTKTWYFLLVTTGGVKYKIDYSNSYPIEWREWIKDPVECKNFIGTRKHNAESYIATTEWFDNNPA